MRRYAFVFVLLLTTGFLGCLASLSTNTEPDPEEEADITEDAGLDVDDDDADDEADDDADDDADVHFDALSDGDFDARDDGDAGADADGDEGQETTNVISELIDCNDNPSAGECSDYSGTPSNIGSIPSLTGSSYIGGLTFKDGFLYETQGKQNHVWEKDPNTGSATLVITVSGLNKLMGLTYDPQRDWFWSTKEAGQFVGYDLQGQIQKTSPEIGLARGIRYEKESDSIWLSGFSNYAYASNKIVMIDAETMEVIDEISAPDHISGSLKVNDYIWVSGRGDAPDDIWRNGCQDPATADAAGAPFYIRRLTLEGLDTGIQVQVPMHSGYCWDLSGFTIDDEGCLWLKSESAGKLYKFDVGLRARL